jgi:hypothetical protein
MKRCFSIALVVVFFFCGVITPVSAGTTTFTPGVTPGVLGSINSDGFFVGTDLYGAYAIASGGSLSTSGAGYSDAGVVVGFDGSLKLGSLLGVSVSSTGSPLAMNLWFDTSGDGKFFKFGGLSGYEMTSLNGDSYGGGSLPAGLSSDFYMFGGNGAGSTNTLAELQNGSVSGIDGNTPVAFWIGITNAGGQALDAEVNSITVRTADPVPEPTSLLLMGGGLLSLGLIYRRKRVVTNK